MPSPKALRERGCSFSLGFSVNVAVQDAINLLPLEAWTPGHNRDGKPRRGEFGVKIT